MSLWVEVQLLGEAHMKKDFYTSNLTDLIELTARNINTIYSFQEV